MKLTDADPLTWVGAIRSVAGLWCIYEFICGYGDKPDPFKYPETSDISMT